MKKGWEAELKAQKDASDKEHNMEFDKLVSKKMEQDKALEELSTSVNKSYVI